MMFPVRDRRKQPLRRGFTLLELVIVLALIGLAMGGAMTLFLNNSAERRLRDISADIELLAKKARALAMVQQIPYAITFTESAFEFADGWIEMDFHPLTAGIRDRSMEARR